MSTKSLGTTGTLSNKSLGTAMSAKSLGQVLMSTSKNRHVSAKLEDYARPMACENELVGVSIKEFDIGTGQGSVGDPEWYANMNKELEVMAQNFSIPIPHRLVCIPQTIYPNAHVVIEGKGVWLSWDATDALHAWAKCHQTIPVKSRTPVGGVNVLKPPDDETWEIKSDQRRKVLEDDDEDPDLISVFHYDWTYSTPFSGKVEGGGDWEELEESGMRMELLKDQMLFFDDILMYEDDLQGNGKVQYSVKLRVSPSSVYLVARLFVRVDNVILRVRETRILIDFYTPRPRQLKPRIYRDINWRECNWDNLEDHNLPRNVKKWTCDPYTSEPDQVERWQSRLQQLPEVKLPKNLIQYSVLEPGKEYDDDEDSEE